MNGSFTQKEIEIRITLNAGSFGGKGVEKIIRGLPVEVRVSKPGGFEAGKASIQIGGLTVDEMSQLTTLAFRPLEARHNKIAIFAGDFMRGLSCIFAGEIYTAFADFNKSPDPVFKIECICGYYPNLLAVGPLTIKGDAPVSDLISQQAKLAGYQFENQGVTTRLKNAVFNGSPVQKIKAMAKQAGAQVIIDDDRVLLLQKDKERQGSRILISAQTGMLGYPSFSTFGIEVDTLFNPDYRMFGVVEVQSIVPKASGAWKIIKIEHNLTAYQPSAGPWNTHLTACYISSKTSESNQ